MSEELEVQEAEFTEVEEDFKIPRCIVQLTLDEDGSVSFRLDGSEQSLVNIEGLLKYAEKHMEVMWKERLPK